jgi:hypothetical protein
MGDIIPIKTINSPALANAFGYQESDLTDGAALGFPVLTYRGKVWRIMHKGNETPLLTPEGDPLPSVRVVILKANKNLSKIFYEKAYAEGDSDAPDCFSMDGEKPDSSVKEPPSANCASCPNAAWGSKMSDDGKELKACQDSRRLVVVPCNNIANEALGGPMLLRVPAASLGNLVAYDDTLKNANAAYFGVATKVSFDMEAAYPRLMFEYDGPNTENMSPEDGQMILELREGEAARRILQTKSVQEHGSAGDDTPKQPAKQPVKTQATKTPAQPPVVEVPEETVTKPEQEEPSPPTASETGEVEAATETDVDALVSGLLNG